MEENEASKIVAEKILAQTKANSYDVPIEKINNQDPKGLDAKSQGGVSILHSPVNAEKLSDEKLSDETAQAIIKGIEIKKLEVAEMEKRLDEKIKTLTMLTESIAVRGKGQTAPEIPQKTKEEKTKEDANKFLTGTGLKI